MPLDWLSFLLGVLAAFIPQLITLVVQERFRKQQEKREAKRQREELLLQLEFEKFRELEQFFSELIVSVSSGAPVGERLLISAERFKLGFPNYDLIGEHLDTIVNLYVVVNAEPSDAKLKQLQDACRSVITTCRTALANGIPPTPLLEHNKDFFYDFRRHIKKALKKALKGR
jgi:hypothetical protein